MLASAMSSPASACGSFDVVLGALFCAFLISTLHHTGRHGPCDDRSLRLRVQYSCPIFTHADINFKFGASHSVLPDLRLSGRPRLQGLLHLRARRELPAGVRRDQLNHVDAGGMLGCYARLLPRSAFTVGTVGERTPLAASNDVWATCGSAAVNEHNFPHPHGWHGTLRL